MYSFVFFFLLPVVIFAVAWSQCFWTNLINGLLIVLSSALAFNYAQLLADMINKQAPEWSAFTEFGVMWLLFWIIFSCSKFLTMTLSKYPVRFGGKRDPWFDFIGCVWVMNLMYGWICFTFFASPIGDPGFINMMASRGTPTNMMGMMYGASVIGLPSHLGMTGSQPFDPTKWAKSRLERARDEVNNVSK
ncbi:hypothetical protein [Bremerella cremea]|uniref:hypothetical protein n=1 Tax=Bremerella cremea TaxID=1031537 RepID=UPI0031E6B098